MTSLIFQNYGEFCPKSAVIVSWADENQTQFILPDRIAANLGNTVQKDEQISKYHPVAIEFARFWDVLSGSDDSF